MRFHRATGGAIESYEVRVEQLDRLMLGAAYGEPTMVALAQAISSWTDEAMRPGGDCWCVNCPVVFHPENPPAAYVIALPFANRAHAMVSAICARCAARDEDLKAMAMRRWRKVWPDMYSVDGGGHG
jgi:hypothetical protein